LRFPASATLESTSSRPLPPEPHGLAWRPPRHHLPR
jgi:hypothetical protein